MSELEDVLRAGAADWLLRAVTRDLRARSAANGGAPSFPVAAHRALELLATYADTPAVSDTGPPAGILLDVMRGMEPAPVAAERAGCSARHARRLAGAGRVRSYRAGPRCLLIDTEGLRTAVKGSA